MKKSDYVIIVIGIIFIVALFATIIMVTFAVNNGNAGLHFN